MGNLSTAERHFDSDRQPILVPSPTFGKPSRIKGGANQPHSRGMKHDRQRSRPRPQVPWRSKISRRAFIAGGASVGIGAVAMLGIIRYPHGLFRTPGPSFPIPHFDGYPPTRGGSLIPVWTFTPQDSGSGELFTPTSGTYGFNQKFTMPSPATAISVLLYASVVGTPGPLVVTLKDSSGNVLGSGSISASSIVGKGWTPPIPVSLTRSLTAGSVYTASLSAQKSSSSNYYNVWINDATPNWWDQNAGASYSIVLNGIGNTGSSVLRGLDQAGTEVVTLPLSSWNTGPGKTLTFTANSVFSFATVSPWLSDMHQTVPGYQGMFTVTDVTTGQVLATAPAAQATNSHGTMGLLPFTLNNTVTTVPWSPVSGNTQRARLRVREYCSGGTTSIRRPWGSRARG